MTTSIARVLSRALSLSFFTHTFLFSLILFIFLSRRLPRKHTCCANFKSGYTGTITIPRLRYFTKIVMQRMCRENQRRQISLAISIFNCRISYSRNPTVLLFIFYLLGIDHFSNLFLYRIFSGLRNIRLFLLKCTS